MSLPHRVRLACESDEGAYRPGHTTCRWGDFGPPKGEIEDCGDCNFQIEDWKLICLCFCGESMRLGFLLVSFGALVEHPSVLKISNLTYRDKHSRLEKQGIQNVHL